ncbi:MAG: DNA repair protein RecN [Alphaproteobacteria bacterium]|nr:DNA repair protein RecN [Alphaproteobacteria bacterium]
MLSRLYISNIVLIDRLELEFGRGLNVLTGETGAGKSILLDALALALGARSEAGLVRTGSAGASVTAEFDIGTQDITHLHESGIETDNGILILRRTLDAHGKSKAWINDVPVSVKMLKQIGDTLIEIHGQFENHTLLDPSTHITSLDEFGGHNEFVSSVRIAYQEMRNAEKKLGELRDMLARSAAEREFLEHNVQELETLKPIPGEEEDLSNRRAAMMDAEKNAGILADAKAALNGTNRGLSEQIFNIAHILERVKTDPNPYQPQIDKLYDTGNMIAEIEEQIAPASLETADLEQTEERLFALRAIARKHRISPDELSDRLIQMQEQLAAIDDNDAALHKLESEVKSKKSDFIELSKNINLARVAASEKLRKAILSELPALKLGQADFAIQIESGEPSSTGTDVVTFMIRTNPGSNFAPLHKIASGGELARLMLALRVVLMRGDTEKSFVFDEVDAGISGATASAVGERLGRLAAAGQALVITHSAQVAGHADKHFLIKKTSTKDATTTTVSGITGTARINEIARIISGEKITDESLAAAKALLKK